MTKLLNICKMGGVILGLLFFASSCSDDDDDVRYKVVVTADENGTAVASPTEAAAGETVTLTATANDGFGFSNWTVEGNNATLENASAASTTFTMPASDVIIRASFAEGGGLPYYEDILPLLKDEFVAEYAKYRMNYPERINEKNSPAWDLNLDGKLSSDEAAKVTAINISGTFDDMEKFDISLEDLQYFPNLETLVIDYQSVSGGVEVFTKLTKLVYLSFQHCYMPENALVDLSHCTDLVTALFYENFMSAINVSTCANLAELDVTDTPITELDLSSSTKLNILVATLSPIKTLDLSHCTALQIIELASCDELVELKLPSNSRITKIVANNTQITELDMTQHPLVSYLSVGGSSDLKKLDLTKCPALVTLACSYTPIGKLDLSNCPKLTLLWATQCKLTELILPKKFDSYCEINCQHNYLDKLDITGNDFYFDKETQKQTDSYLLHCGQQVSPGSEPFDDIKGEVKYDEWDKVTKEMTLTMRTDQKPYWESMLLKSRANGGVKVQIQN